MQILEDLSNGYCLIDDETFQSVVNTQGVFFEKICHLNKKQIASDLLNAGKGVAQAEILQRYCDLAGKKVLEIGSGLGVNHIVWTNKYGIDGYGVEPSEDGFDSSYDISKRLIIKNSLDPSKIINSVGEKLPFPDNSFDIVYSTNVLEHTANPELVVQEAFRVLRRNGIMQLVYPNYHSYFDGHYAVFHPPIFLSGFFPWYVKTFFCRDPSFAKTLRTELNIPWTKQILKRLTKIHELQVISLGQEIFMERMCSQNFQAWAGLTKVASVLDILNRVSLNKVAAKAIILANGINPIILTVKKGGCH